MACPGVGDQTATPELPLEDLSPPELTYHHYVYNPRHMLCLMCSTEELSMMFWGWWLRERKLPPVSALVQGNCCLGFSCTQQRRADHAREVDVSLSTMRALPFRTLNLALLPCGRTGRYLNALVSTQIHQSFSNISGTTPTNYHTPSRHKDFDIYANFMSYFMAVNLQPRSEGVETTTTSWRGLYSSLQPN